jgi:hypothetical protein
MEKYNIFYSPFSHASSSTWYKKSNNIIWENNSTENDISFYVDYLSIKNGIGDKKNGKIKYLWHLESPIINQSFVETVKSNLDEVLDAYENIFTYSDELLSLHPKFVFSPANGFWIESPKIYEKTKLISMICSSKQGSELQNFRVDFANKNKTKLDLYGGISNPIPIKELGLNEYMFSVCVENCDYNTYFTEKILDCFATGTIPIYKGTRNITKHFNEEGIIFLDDIDIHNLNKDIYFSKMDAIKDNLERVSRYSVLEDWIYMNYINNKI